MEFIGDRRAAHLSAALEHERFVARLGQIESSDQSIVATADDDDFARV
jgi:hypothetical protein